MRSVLIAFLTFTSFSGIALAAHTKRIGVIPEALWGSWALTSDLCKGIDKPLAISAQAYVSSEATCKVMSVSETPGGRGSIYSAHLLCSKEPGKTTESNLILVPTKDPNRISMGPDFRNLKNYERCTSTSSSRVK